MSQCLKARDRGRVDRQVLPAGSMHPAQWMSKGDDQGTESRQRMVKRHVPREAQATPRPGDCVKLRSEGRVRVRFILVNYMVDMDRDLQPEAQNFVELKGLVQTFEAWNLQGR